MSDSVLDALTGRSRWGDKRNWLLGSDRVKELAAVIDSIDHSFDSPLDRTFDMLSDAAASMKDADDKDRARLEIQAKREDVLPQYKAKADRFISVLKTLSSYLSSSDFRKLLERKYMEDAVSAL